ncbi:MAG TPA: alpha-2-macroglobulin family protein [Actinomycetota bacterium]|nr:alpha-2-macroglobulin family protein [Actinomycetota bacterium]
MGTTGADGTASFASSLLGSGASPSGAAARAQQLILSGPGGTQATVPVGSSLGQADSTGVPTEFGDSDAAAGYWQFLTTDRPLYRLSDTVEVWGVLRQRTQLNATQKVVLQLSGGLYGTAAMVAQATVTTGPDGTFQAALSYQDAAPGFYSVEALVGGQVISNTGLQIADFITPPYSLTVTPSQHLVVAGDPVTFTVQASFFDGSPVANLALTASFGEPPTPYQLTTNAAGVATFTAVPPGGNDPPDQDTLNVTPTIPEQANISGAASVQVLSAAVTAEWQALREASSIVVSGTVHAVDLAKANAPGAAAPEGYQGDAIPGQPVTLIVTATSYSEVQTGQSYNFIQNSTVPQYTFTAKSVSQTVHATTDARGAFHLSVPAAGGAAPPAYAVELVTADSAGRADASTIYPFMPGPPTQPSLALSVPGPFSLGAQVNVTAYPGSVVTGTGTTGAPYLFTVASNGLLAHSVQSADTYTFNFSAADVPDATVEAVYFTGSSYVAVGSQTADFDTGSKALLVHVAPARSGYRPGDKATLDISVTQGGQPVRAQVLVSVVDSAIFSVAPQLGFPSTDILSNLYASVPSGIIATFMTPTGASGPLGGSGPALPVTSGPTLENIRDDADFTQVATGADGTATVTFTLPDNLTSWAVQTLAVTGDLSAGSGTTLVPVGLPLFVNPTLNASYLTGETATVRVAAYGDGLKEGEPVTFTVDAPGLAPAPLVMTGTAFAPVDITLPPLTPGNHSLTFRVSAGGQSEGIVKTISVVGSRLTSANAQYSQLGAGDTWAPPATTSVADVTLTDASRGSWYPELLGLSFAAGNRVDQALAADGAGNLLTEFFGAPSPTSHALAAYQELDGALALLPYGSDDELASAEAAALNLGSVSRSGLISYLQGVLTNKATTAEQATIALYGLAGLGQPVLPEIQAAAASGTLDPSARLYDGLAAAEIGDTDLARSLYRSLLLQYGQAEGAMNRLEVDAVPDDVYQATALAAELGAYLGDSHAAGFELYVDANPSTTTTVVAAQVLFLRQLLPQLPAGDAEVSYTLDGSTTRKSLGGGSTTLHLTPSQMQGLDLRGDRGTVAVTVSEQLPVTPATAKVDRTLSLSRSYSATNVGVGAIVNITLTYHLGAGALAGCYQLTDLLPSGFKALADPFQLASDGPTLTTPYAIQGQSVSFCAVKGTGGTGSITYAALAVEPGTYLAEPATLQAQSDQQSLAFSGGTTVVIH